MIIMGFYMRPSHKFHSSNDRVAGKKAELLPVWHHTHVRAQRTLRTSKSKSNQITIDELTASQSSSSHKRACTWTQWQKRDKAKPYFFSQLTNMTREKKNTCEFHKQREIMASKENAVREWVDYIVSKKWQTKRIIKTWRIWITIPANKQTKGNKQKMWITYGHTTRERESEI